MNPYNALNTVLLVSCSLIAVACQSSISASSNFRPATETVDTPPAEEEVVAPKILPFDIKDPQLPAATTQSEIYLSGTCPTDLKDLTTNQKPAVEFVDSDCSDGVFIIGPIPVHPGNNSVTVRGLRANGSAVDTSITFEAATPDGSFAIKSPAKTLVRGNKRSHQISGTCSKAGITLSVAPAAYGLIDNRCAADGTFKIAVTLPSDGVTTVTVTGTLPNGGKTSAALTYDVDSVPPALAITAPTTQAAHRTDSRDVVVSGTCDTTVTKLTATPFAATDANCADGTFAISVTSLAVGRHQFTVRGEDAHGNAATRKITIDKLVVLGQPDFTTNSELEASELQAPMSVWTDGTKFAVADMYNHRVLLFNNMPSSPTARPDVVLGQPSVSVAVQNFEGVSGRTMSLPVKVLFAAGKLFVVDSGNNRVLVWNSWPTTTGQPADFALGQPSLQHNAANFGGVNAASLARPLGITSDGTRLAVVDNTNQRVLIWNTIPTMTATPADLVIGQASMEVAGGGNAGGIGKGFSGPTGVLLADNKLFVADRSNGRVAVFDPIPVASYPSVSFVIGQSLPTSGNCTNRCMTPAANSLAHPQDMHVQGTRLYVADTMNNRVLVWNTVPTTNLAAADLVLGQADFVSMTVLRDTDTTAASLYHPMGVWDDGANLWVADSGNHRILRFDRNALTNNADSNAVFGRPSATRGSRSQGLSNLTPGFVSAITSATTFAVRSPDGKLIVSDYMRILIYNTFPTSPDAVPDVILGQPNIHGTTTDNDTGSPTCRSLDNVTAVATDGVRLYAADTFNNRVLIWDTMPTTHYQPADRVLGQPNCNSATANNGALVAGARLSGPTGIAAFRIDATTTKLLISDTNNNRVLVYDNIPAAANTAANAILGQTNATNLTANNPALGLSSLSSPGPLDTDGTHIVVADRSNQRVLLWDAWPTGFAAPASRVLGQPSGTLNTANAGVLPGPSNMSSVRAADLYNDGTNVHIGVADAGNNRALIWNSWPTADYEPADRVLGQPDFTKVTAIASANNLDVGNSQSINLSSSGIAVVRTSTSRVSEWRTLTPPNFAPPDATTIFGRMDAETSRGAAAARAERVTRTEHQCRYGAIGGGKVFCIDATANRVLVWQQLPTENNTPPDIVLGQPDFTSYKINNDTGGASARTLSNPGAVWSDGVKLVIVDRGNSRALVWTTFPTTSYAPADLVLGQPDFTTTTPHGATMNASQLSFDGLVADVGRGVASDGTRLAIGNGARISLWHTFPTANNEPADVVLGQPDMTDNRINVEGKTDRTMMGAVSLALNGDALYAVDAGNRRIMRWNTWPTVNFAPADYILKKTVGLVFGPRSIVADGDWFAASDDNRIYAWRNPTKSDAAPDAIFGQPDLFTTSVAPPGMLTAGAPIISLDDGKVLIQSSYDDRMVLMPAAMLWGAP